MGPLSRRLPYLSRGLAPAGPLSRHVVVEDSTSGGSASLPSLPEPQSSPPQSLCVPLHAAPV